MKKFTSTHRHRNGAVVRGTILAPNQATADRMLAPFLEQVCCMCLLTSQSVTIELEPAKPRGPIGRLRKAIAQVIAP